MKLKICYYGNPVLREKANPVTEITDEIRKIADDLLETMRFKDGIGLAAPQAGIKLRMFVSIVSEDVDGEPNIVTEPIVYINPIISHPSIEIRERSEGCISLPKLYIQVPRPVSCLFEATGLDGRQIKFKCHGFLARHLMHENDHLNGVLMIDRLRGKSRKLIEHDLRRIKKMYAS